ncbi:MAG: hypothetical protein KDA75_22570, partial [Planctomycetaceae bacterium]|nr:hypothetical protein [Planctomycetaceae bacterium]
CGQPNPQDIRVQAVTQMGVSRTERAPKAAVTLINIGTRRDRVGCPLAIAHSLQKRRDGYLPGMGLLF